MLTQEQEKYVFRHLSLIDMERVKKSLEIMNVTTDDYIKEAMFRDAVISYAKPFSGNRGENIKKRLRINQKGIPAELRDAHLELIDIRNKLFAHNDLVYQKADFGPGTSFTVKGYEKVFVSHLLQPLLKLADTIHSKLMKELDSIEANDL